MTYSDVGSPIIETPRLLLRLWKEEDLIPFRIMNSDPDVMQYFERRLTPAQSDGFAEVIHQEHRDKGWGLMAVERKDSGKFCGFVGFHEAQFDADFTPCVEIGWRLSKENWGLGFATEAARHCLIHGFDRCGFYEVYSFATVTNRPSIAVMKKIGLRYQRKFDHPALATDHPLCPHVLYRITKDEYAHMQLGGKSS